MPKLDPVGRVDDPTQIDLEPVVIPVVGYKLVKGKPTEVVEEFSFRPVMPAGAQLDVLRNMSADGMIPVPLIMTYLDESLLEEDRDRFNEFLHDPTVMIEQETVIQMYRSLFDYYGARPTQRASDSDGGGSSTKRTSRGASRSAASRSRPSRSA